MYSIAAKQAKGKFAQDNIFAANNKAVALADKLGNDKVINTTVGSIPVSYTHLPAGIRMGKILY